MRGGHKDGAGDDAKHSADTESAILAVAASSWSLIEKTTQCWRFHYSWFSSRYINST
jgi:hypothetical protein